MKTCLKEASKDNHQSIALPAIGTGNLGVPRDLAARFLYEEVTEYSRKHPNQNVRDIRFVVYPQDTQTVAVSIKCILHFHYHLYV